MLGYNVGFPLSLVINKKVIIKYQMLFRHLLKCKYLERSLTSTWLDGAKMGENMCFSEGQVTFKSVRNQISALRGKMLHFIHQMTYYMFFEVIEPQWNFLESSIMSVIIT